jgi:hypothetical protein
MRSNKNKISFFFSSIFGIFRGRCRREREKKSRKIGSEFIEGTKRTNEHKPANAERKKEKGEVVVVVGMTIETFKLFLNISSRGRDWPRVFLSTEEGPRVAKRQRKRVNLALITQITNVF